MGVLECDRYGCGSIMCDYYSHNHGYICHECFSELKTKVSVNIAEFMESPKGKPFLEGVCSWEDYCDLIFTERNNTLDG